MEKTLGEGNDKDASRYFSMMVWVTLIVGILISLLGILFTKPIAELLGATGEMLNYAVIYGRIIIGFTLAFMFQNLFQSFLITAEKPSLGLKVTIIAGVTNMVLDALFVVVIPWGVTGAALATGLSQVVGGIIPLFYFLKRKEGLHIVKTNLEMRPILSACGNGISEFVTNITSSIIRMAYNFQLLRFAGELGVAAYGVIMYIEFFFAAIFIGLAIGSDPLNSYHYGANNRGELRNLKQKNIKIGVILGVIMTFLSFTLARPLASLFVGYDETLLNMSVEGLQIVSFFFLFVGFNIFSSSFFTALNNGLISAVISFLRTFVIKLGLVLTLPIFLGLNGVWWSSVLAELLTLFVGIFFILKYQKRYGY